MGLKEDLNFLEGDCDFAESSLEANSYTTSIFKMLPKVVVYPKGVEDLKKLVRYVINKFDKDGDKYYITPRAAGTCMSGGSLSESILVKFGKYLNRIGKVVAEKHNLSDRVFYRGAGEYDEGYVSVEPGAYYRDFEKILSEAGYEFPPYTASKDLCALGGMFGNNCGGERSVKLGKFEDYVLESRVVFSDGNEYEVKPLTAEELKAKIDAGGFEGKVYGDLLELLEKNYDLIMKEKPRVSKNSAGYYLWNVWDKDRKIFNLNKLLVGSQGTLGMITGMTLRVIKGKKERAMLLVYVDDFAKLGELVKVILEHSPDSVEVYDDNSMKLAFKFIGGFLKSMGLRRFITFAFKMLPDLIRVVFHGFPRLAVIVEMRGDDKNKLDSRMRLLQYKIGGLGFDTRLPSSYGDMDKYWRIRRESFNLLRHHIKHARTVPFIDDFVVPTDALPKFVPELKELLDSCELEYTVAGHIGDGNFHIIPIMDMRDAKNVNLIDELSEKVYDLVVSYGGSITGEHNDGLIRTPYLNKMFSDEMLGLFEKVKEIFDPVGIFNLNKKTGFGKEEMIRHIMRNNAHG